MVSRTRSLPPAGLLRGPSSRSNREVREICVVALNSGRKTFTSNTHSLEFRARPSVSQMLSKKVTSVYVHKVAQAHCR